LQFLPNFFCDLSSRLCADPFAQLRKPAVAIEKRSNSVISLFGVLHNLLVLAFSRAIEMRLSVPLIASCLAATASAYINSQARILPRASFCLTAKKKVFIDGEAGTTGIQVRDRLAGREELEIISIPDNLRKDEDTRKKLINEADAVILCKYKTCPLELN
jgi:hypothetical protein